jgi:hypothetical protein
MTPPEARPNKAIATALWVNAGLLALIVVVLLSRNGGPSILPAAYAQNQQPIAGGGGVFIMPCQLQPNAWGCYLLDIDAKTISTYQYWPGDHTMRLQAARTYRYDTKLENFNSPSPTPKEVKSLVEKQQAGIGAAPAADEKDKEKDK